MKTVRKKVVIALAITFLVGLPIGVFAAANQSIYVGPQEIIEGNFIKAGNVIDIQGAVNGDVIVAGSSITIAGPVAGDVIAAGNTIRITGIVSGSVRVVGSSVEINSAVEKNVWAVGSTVNLGPESKVGWDVYAAGANVEIKGPVAGNVLASAASIVIDNEVGKDVKASVDKEGQIILYPKAKVGGNLTYKAATTEQLILKEGATVVGQTTKTELPVPSEREFRGFLHGFLGFMKVMSFFSLLVIGLVLVTLIPKVVFEIRDEMMKKPQADFGWGLVYLIIVPVLVFLLAITLIGLPLALIIMFLYVIALFIAKVMVGFTIGLIVLDRFNKEKKYKGSLIWPLVIGLLIFVILTSLPLVGWLIKLILVIWALGAILQFKKQALKEYR
ncbi:MAG: hypothetical protein WC675_05490 [Patescibacteria group bacterium]|jgi:cytoskeletal protein CcmA (bactofilin family)